MKGPSPQHTHVLTINSFKRLCWSKEMRTGFSKLVSKSTLLLFSKDVLINACSHNGEINNQRLSQDASQRKNWLRASND
jgi:hypothetical protein